MSQDTNQNANGGGGLNVAVLDPTLIAQGNDDHNNDGNASNSGAGSFDTSVTAHSNDGNTSNSGAGSFDKTVTAHSDDGNTSNTGASSFDTSLSAGNQSTSTGSNFDKASGNDDGNQSAASGSNYDKASNDGNVQHSYNGDISNSGAGALYDKAADDGNSGNAGALLSGNSVSDSAYAFAHDSGNSTSIGIDLSHVFGDLTNSGSVLVMPQDITQSVGTGAGTSALIALDQVNSLVSNNSAYDNNVTDDNHSTGQHVFGGADIEATGGSANHDTGTDALSANASANVTLSAFTQSIVLGANLQNNSFTIQVSGHDSANDGGVIHHS